MLKYLIIQLCDSATSFCYYECKKDAPKLISIKDLEFGLLWAMKENLIVQFVYPQYELPAEYYKLIDTVDHIDIKANDPNVDIPIYTGINDIPVEKSSLPMLLRLTKKEFIANVERLRQYPLLNIVITDIATLTENEQEEYKKALQELSLAIQIRIENNEPTNLNLLTDRIQLSEMNNCNAGIESISLAPDGKFYICPAFYFDGDDHVGTPHDGLTIQNSHLYKLEYAPICKNCDSFQCKRCVWLNKKTTYEINIPSHEQCVASHIERNISRKLLDSLKKSGNISIDITIPKIDYIDPFDKF